MATEVAGLIAQIGGVADRTSDRKAPLLLSLGPDISKPGDCDQASTQQALQVCVALSWIKRCHRRHFHGRQRLIFPPRGRRAQSVPPSSEKPLQLPSIGGQGEPFQPSLSLIILDSGRAGGSRERNFTNAGLRCHGAVIEEDIFFRSST